MAFLRRSAGTVTQRTLDSPILTTPALGTPASGEISGIQDGWVHILTKSVNNGNSLSINASDGWDTTTYDQNWIEMTNFSDFSSNEQLSMYVEYNGSFDEASTTNYRYHVTEQRSSSNAMVEFNSGSTSHMVISVYDTRNTNYVYGTMNMYCNKFNGLARQQFFWSFSHSLVSTGASLLSTGIGGYDPSSHTVTGVKFWMSSSGTYDATFKVFGSNVGA